MANYQNLQSIDLHLYVVKLRMMKGQVVLLQLCLSGNLIKIV